MTALGSMKKHCGQGTGTQQDEKRTRTIYTSCSMRRGKLLTLNLADVEDTAYSNEGQAVRYSKRPDIRTINRCSYL